MKKKMQLTQREFDQFEDYLRHDEREESTIEAYLRSLTRFAEWADGRSVTKELAMEWKTALAESGYRPISVNAMLAAVNKFFICMGREDCKVKYLKLQRQMFRKSEKDLSKEEYQRLVQAAHEKGDLRMELILETICATGIRVGELKYITLEAVRAGVAEIALKGKFGPSCSLAACAASCKSTPNSKKSPRARFFSPKTVSRFPGNLSGPA